MRQHAPWTATGERALPRPRCGRGDHRERPTQTCMNRCGKGCSPCFDAATWNCRKARLMTQASTSHTPPGWSQCQPRPQRLDSRVGSRNQMFKVVAFSGRISFPALTIEVIFLSECGCYGLGTPIFYVSFFHMLHALLDTQGQRQHCVGRLVRAPLRQSTPSHAMLFRSTVLGRGLARQHESGKGRACACGRATEAYSSHDVCTAFAARIAPEPSGCASSTPGHCRVVSSRAAKQSQRPAPQLTLSCAPGQLL